MEVRRNERLDSLNSYFARESFLASQIDVNQIEVLVQKLANTTSNKGRVFIAGNGGSAATAEHFAADLGFGTHIRAMHKAVDAISLTANAAVLTAIGNDMDFELVFSKQFEIHCPTSRDFVIVISASGNSPNILRLLEIAKSLEVMSCAITGFDGGAAKTIADISIHVPSEKGEYGIVEDLHLAICHAISESLRK